MFGSALVSSLRMVPRVLAVLQLFQGFSRLRCWGSKSRCTAGNSTRLDFGLSLLKCWSLSCGECDLLHTYTVYTEALLRLGTMKHSYTGYMTWTLFSPSYQTSLKPKLSNRYKRMVVIKNSCNMLDSERNIDSAICAQHCSKCVQLVWSYL